MLIFKQGRKVEYYNTFKLSIMRLRDCFLFLLDEIVFYWINEQKAIWYLLYFFNRLNPSFDNRDIPDIDMFPI